MRKTRIWSAIIIALVMCLGITSQIPVVKQIIHIKFGNSSKTYIGWILSEGLRGSNQWHVTSERVTTVGAEWGMLNPGSDGPGMVFCDYYPPGTKLFKIPGFNPLDALAVQQPDNSYVLAVRFDRVLPLGNNLNFTCEGWIVPNGTNLTGHYKVISSGVVSVGRMIGKIGTNFTTPYNAYPKGTPIYMIYGVDPKVEIAVGRWHTRAIWTPTSHS